MSFKIVMCAKWLEAVAYSLAAIPIPSLKPSR